MIGVELTGEIPPRQAFAQVTIIDGGNLDIPSSQFTNRFPADRTQYQIGATAV
jgi:hypothetical protein